MGRKKKVEEDQSLGPTPYLSTPRANRQVFTVSENKLLDQITLEICEAWAKDLKTIRECQKETTSTIQRVSRVSEFLEEINEKIDKHEFISQLQDLFERQQQTFLFMEEIRQSCFQTQEQVLGLRKMITETLEKLKDKPKKWWKFWS